MEKVLTEKDISKELVTLITPEMALNYLVIPKMMVADKLCLYTCQLEQTRYQEELEIILGKIISFEVIPEDQFLPVLHQLYRLRSDHHKNKELITLNHKGIDFLQNIFEEAFFLGSSDIHIEPLKESCRIRFRIDGKLIEQHFINKAEYPAVLNKIKVKSNLDIAEKRLPQDGRLTMTVANDAIDIRVSTLPSVFGEKVVLRLLSNSISADIDIDQLGLSERQTQDFLTGIKNTSGLILICGPTGSGKTTTLYATLKLLNKSDVNILTIEDPVEYMINGANQVQLKENIGLTFANALRTFLRQDPDIIMLGEIRDPETAQMAIRASLTGHLVLSTIHTNSAWGTVTRLVDMGIQPFLIADTLLITASQRLVRKLCPDCKVLVHNPDNIIPEYVRNFDKGIPIYQAIGCAKCHYTGYKGRIGIYEVIPVNRELSEFIKKGETDIKDYLLKVELASLSESAMNLVKSGYTSLEEVLPILISIN